LKGEKKMRKMAMIIGFLGVFIMLVGLPSAFAAPASHERFSTGWEPFEFVRTSQCPDGEDVLITGLTLSRYEAIDLPSGAFNFASLIIWRGTGVGLTTGARYKWETVWPAIFTCPSSGVCVFASPNSGRLISLEPNVPNDIFKFFVHMTIDANGEMRVYIENAEAICR
jgi:hypothetical protein